MGKFHTFISTKYKDGSIARRGTLYAIELLNSIEYGDCCLTAPSIKPG